MPRAGPDDLPGQAYGSLRSAWKAYEIAVGDENERGAKQAACVINGIRAGHGMDPIEFDSLGGFVCDEFLSESCLSKLPKGSSCTDWKAVPAISDYWKDDTTKVTRCGKWNTSGDGDGTAPPDRDPGPPDGNGDGDGDGPMPNDPPREVNGWEIKREREDLVDYSAPYYEGLPTGDLKEGTEPHEVAEVMVRTIGTESRKFPNRWTARVIVWNTDDENVYETPIMQAVKFDDPTRNRNAALDAAINWMEEHEASVPPEPEPDPEPDDDADGDPDGDFPDFRLEIKNGRLREVLEPFKRFPRKASDAGHMTVDDAGVIEFIGMDSSNVVMYESALSLASAESATIDDEGDTVAFATDALATVASDRNMGDSAVLRTDGDKLIYESGGVTERFTMDVTTVGMPDFPDPSIGLVAEGITAKRFKRTVRGLSKVNDDSVALVADAPQGDAHSGELYMVTEDNEGNRARGRLTSDDDKFRSLGDRDLYTVLFSYDYLRSISLSPYSPGSTDVRFELYDFDGVSPDTEGSGKFTPTPLNVIYEQRGGMVNYTLAPRVVTDKANSNAKEWDLSAPCPFTDTDDPVTLEQPEAGDDLPDVEGMDFDGDTVVWSFPNTDGCRCGAQALQYETLAEEHGVNVYALATSTPEELHKMAERLDLERVTFVSDPGGNLAEAFGIERDGDGNLERTTLFVRDGTITDVSDGVPMIEQPTEGACPFDAPTTLSQAGEGELYEAMEHPGVYVITGARGSGKSALAHQLGEQIHEREDVTAVTVGQPKHVREHYPDHWVHVNSVKNAPPNSVLVLDEAYMRFHARDAMDDANKAMGARVNTSRHCDQTMIFVAQNSRHLDTFAVGEADGLFMKQPGQFHKKFERSKIRDMTEQVESAFGQLPSNMNEQKYVYAWTNDLEGMVQNDMPSWYGDEVSKSYGSACSVD